MCRIRQFFLFNLYVGLGLRMATSSLAPMLVYEIRFDRPAACGATPKVLPGAAVLSEGKLMAKLSAAPLKHVMEKSSDLSGAEIVWPQQGEASRVSVDCSHVSFIGALRLRLHHERVNLAIIQL